MHHANQYVLSRRLEQSWMESVGRWSRSGRRSDAAAVGAAALRHRRPRHGVQVERVVTGRRTSQTVVRQSAAQRHHRRQHRRRTSMSNTVILTRPHVSRPRPSRPRPQPHVTAALPVPDHTQRMSQHYFNEAFKYS